MARYLITSALPYINGIKHLGNLIGSMLPADVYARFLRREGESVLYICATDEHGTPAELAAREAGMDVAEYCDQQHRNQAEIYDKFGLSFDYFGRTSSQQNTELTQHIYRQLEANGFIQERSIEQVYSVDDERFLPDRYVVGTCPKCGYEAARGDQCEQCTSVLEPTDLVNPRSAISNSTNLERKESKHLFLQLDKLSDEVKRWVDSHPHWPKLTISIANKWLDEGLKERCITRDLKWGIDVPRDDLADKVFYVWFDAPIGYIGATKEWSDQDKGRDYRSWWYEADDVNYVQFMAKDNLPFHTIFWPATMLGTREPWTMSTYIKGFNWLTYYGGKFSTSQKRGVFMDHALSILPADYWRYFLLAQAPESDDSDFTWEMFASVVNKDLASNFGNFVFRVLKLTRSKFGSVIPDGGEMSEREEQLQRDCDQVVGEYKLCMEKMEYRKAIAALRSLWSLGNVYIDERAPWSLVKSDKEAAGVVMRTAINLVRLFATAADPVIPFTSERLFDCLKLTDAERSVSVGEVRLDDLCAGREFEVPDVLFRRIEDDEIEKYGDEYGGVE